MSQATTQEKILLAARKLFAQHGYSGTSVGNIAKLAKVNHSLVFHHFGNKEKLWLAVKQSIVEEAKGKAAILPSTQQNFKGFLSELVHNTVRFYRDNPDIMRMINWQRMELADKNIGVTLSAESNAWLNAFKHYQEVGEIHSALKPEYIVSFVLAVLSSVVSDSKNELIQDQKAYLEFCIQRFLVALTH